MLLVVWQVKQPHVPASDITYLVVEPPRYGYLELDPPPGAGHTDDNGDEAVTTFSQAAVNARRLRYVQAAANQTRDHMVLTVTNGITQLTNLVVSSMLCTYQHILNKTIFLTPCRLSPIGGNGPVGPENTVFSC